MVISSKTLLLNQRILTILTHFHKILFKITISEANKKWFKMIPNLKVWVIALWMKIEWEEQNQHPRHFRTLKSWEEKTLLEQLGMYLQQTNSIISNQLRFKHKEVFLYVNLQEVKVQFYQEINLIQGRSQDQAHQLPYKIETQMELTPKKSYKFNIFKHQPMIKSPVKRSLPLTNQHLNKWLMLKTLNTFSQVNTIHQLLKMTTTNYLSLTQTPWNLMLETNHTLKWYHREILVKYMGLEKKEKVNLRFKLNPTG